MEINETAARGFAAAAGEYERGRPDYPAEAIAWLVDALGIAAGKTVLDLGAGTGKFTALLVPTSASLIALEPVDGMRARLVAALPSVHAVAGTAERLPLADGTLDAAASAQAFHWFDGPRTLAELHRTLRPGGRLGLTWNARDKRVPWVAEMSGIVDAHGDAIRRHEAGVWREAFEETTLFGPLAEAEFPYAQTLDEDLFVERVASTSFIATMPDAERSAVLGRIRDLVRTHPDTRGRQTFELPYRTRVFWCERAG
jgi:SAM-dependent methyltransferase